MKPLPRKQASDEIPTSSMADIAFLLIIFFMVSTTFAATRGLDFSFPEDDPTLDVEPAEAVLVEVLPGGSLLVDARPMRVDHLLGYLRPKLARNPAKPVIVKPRPEAEYGHMVSVLDELRKGEELLALAAPIQVALPTAREVQALWQ